jgi:hypothetical protein
MTGSQDNNELEKSATLESIRNSHISSTSSSYIELKMLLDERRWEDAQYETIKVMYEIVSQMHLVLPDFVCDKFAGISPIEGCCNQQISEPVVMIAKAIQRFKWGLGIAAIPNLARPLL